MPCDEVSKWHTRLRGHGRFSSPARPSHRPSPRAVQVVVPHFSARFAGGRLSLKHGYCATAHRLNAGKPRGTVDAPAPTELLESVPPMHAIHTRELRSE